MRRSPRWSRAGGSRMNRQGWGLVTTPSGSGCGSSRPRCSSTCRRASGRSRAARPRGGAGQGGRSTGRGRGQRQIELPAGRSDRGPPEASRGGAGPDGGARGQGQIEGAARRGGHGGSEAPGSLAQAEQEKQMLALKPERRRPGAPSSRPSSGRGDRGQEAQVTRAELEKSRALRAIENDISAGAVQLVWLKAARIAKASSRTWARCT